MLLYARCGALVIFCLVLAGAGIKARAGMTAFTEPGKTDFDTALQILNPYGTWSKIDGLWAYTPFDHQAPYTNGRWIYTEYGWFWKGNLPHSWATEHYGYWKRGADHVWSWYPGPYWLAETVEIRSTATHIGWRSAAVDQDGDFIEKPEDRWAKTDEWTFVTLEQFANPITPGMVAKPVEAASQLEDSVESQHTYVTYREIDRPGPHPADFLTLSKDGGMFAPITLQDRLAMQQAPPPLVIPGVTPGTTLTDTNVDAAPVPPATNAPAGLAQAAPSGSAADAPKVEDTTRKVKYWITKCLPTYWTPRPPDAKESEIYIYRPDFYQDEDGIDRRVALWLDPALLRRTKQNLADLLNGGSRSSSVPETTDVGPAVPAVPADATEPTKAHDPFRSPFDNTYHGSGQQAPSASTKGAASSVATNPAPNPNAPIPPPIMTNAAPVNPQ
ncbi:MAG: hypothetical protein LV481_04220 [Methylacidiphilales bacterium]|nr:hypothetical protein [Candidatus Methylacidiphilales bacterium]